MGDFRYALRQFRRSPAFFIASVLLIAIGIAANTLMFSLVNAVLLQPLPVRNPQSLVQLFEIRPNLPPLAWMGHRLYLELVSHSTTLIDITGQLELTISLEHGSYPERIHVQPVTDNYFPSLGIQPALGRLLTKSDRHAAVLSYACWQRSFGSETSAIGSTVRLAGHPFLIVGVTPPQFNGTGLESGPDIRVPHANLSDFFVNPLANVDNSNIEIFARLRPGASLAQAQQETAAFWERDRETFLVANSENRRPWDRDVHLQLQSIEHGVSPLRNQFRTALLVLLGGAGLLLLMVCSNVGGLLLARATARGKETAIRLAIGASRARVVRQWLAESLLLTATGGTMGILIAYAGAPFMVRWIPPVQSGGELRELSLHIRPDSRVLAFCLAAFALTAILAAFAPSWRAARASLQAALKTTMSDVRQRRFQSVLSAAQVALCTVLLAGAGLVSRSLSNLRAVDAGFDRDHIVTFAIDTRVHRYTSAQAWAFQKRLIEKTKALSGVRGAGLSVASLMVGVGMKTTISLPGQQVASKDRMNTSLNTIDPGYFDALGMRLIAGRGFATGEDGEGKPAPVVVNEAFARHFYRGQNPVGRPLGLEAQYRVIGVVSDANYRSLRETPPPIFYIAGFGPKSYPDSFTLHVRTHGDPQSIIAPVREIVRSLDPELPIYQAKTLSSEVERSLWQERLTAALASCFALFALVLSAIGLYGSLAYFVAGRRREIGLRMALGASRTSVVWLVSRQVAGMVLAGTVAGLAASVPIAQTIKSVLFNVRPFDWRSLTAAVFFLAIVGALAAAFPTFRALGVDPSAALRDE